MQNRILLSGLVFTITTFGNVVNASTMLDTKIQEIMQKIIDQVNNNVSVDNDFSRWELFDWFDKENQRRFVAQKALEYIHADNNLSNDVAVNAACKELESKIIQKINSMDKKDFIDDDKIKEDVMKYIKYMSADEKVREIKLIRNYENNIGNNNDDIDNKQSDDIQTSNAQDEAIEYQNKYVRGRGNKGINSSNDDVEDDFTNGTEDSENLKLETSVKNKQSQFKGKHKTDESSNNLNYKKELYINRDGESDDIEQNNTDDNKKINNDDEKRYLNSNKADEYVPNSYSSVYKKNATPNNKTFNENLATGDSLNNEESLDYNKKIFHENSGTLYDYDENNYSKNDNNDGRINRLNNNSDYEYNDANESNSIRKDSDYSQSHYDDYLSSNNEDNKYDNNIDNDALINDNYKKYRNVEWEYNSDISSGNSTPYKSENKNLFAKNASDLTSDDYEKDSDVRNSASHVSRRNNSKNKKDTFRDNRSNSEKLRAISRQLDEVEVR